MRKEVKLSLGGIKYLQAFILFVSFMILFFNGYLAWLNTTDNMVVLVLIGSAVIVTFNWFYAFIYDVSVKENILHIDNLYRHLELGVDNFISIKKAFLIPFLYKITFRDRNVYIMGSSNLMLKEFTANTDEALKSITAKIKK